MSQGWWGWDLLSRLLGQSYLLVSHPLILVCQPQLAWLSSWYLCPLSMCLHAATAVSTPGPRAGSSWTCTDRPRTLGGDARECVFNEWLYHGAGIPWALLNPTAVRYPTALFVCAHQHLGLSHPQGQQAGTLGHKLPGGQSLDAPSEVQKTHLRPAV